MDSRNCHLSIGTWISLPPFLPCTISRLASFGSINTDRVPCQSFPMLRNATVPVRICSFLPTPIWTPPPSSTPPYPLPLLLWRSNAVSLLGTLEYSVWILFCHYHHHSWAYEPIDDHCDHFLCLKKKKRKKRRFGYKVESWCQKISLKYSKTQKIFSIAMENLPTYFHH